MSRISRVLRLISLRVEVLLQKITHKLLKYMAIPPNKIGVALKIFDSAEALVFPGYIDAAVE